MLLKEKNDDYLSRSRKLLPIGIILSFLSTFLHYFGPTLEFLSFLEGMISGISVIFLIAGLFYFGKMKKTSNNISSK